MIKDLTNSQSERQSKRSSDLRAKFVEYQDLQLAMCLKLEAIADSLPNIFDKDLWLKSSQSISPVLEKAHSFEELELYPALLRQKGAELRFADVLKRLESEHHNDEDYAENVAHAIGNYVKHNDHNKAESLSWMLRGFFESIRRHIAFEREHILPFLEGSTKQP